MTNTSEILNAQITNISLGYEDHGILTFGISLNIADGTNCVFGGYALDEYDKETEKRYCPAYSMELITRIMKVVGVSRWEDLKGKYIRVVSNGWGSSIKKIGNLMKNEWFDIDAFFKEYELRTFKRSRKKQSDKKLNYSELRKEIHRILCDFLEFESPVNNGGEFDFEYLEFRTDEILGLIEKQGGTY